MQIVEKTPNMLVIEEGASTWIMIAGFLLIIGVVFVAIGWTQDRWLFGVTARKLYYVHYLTSNGEVIKWCKSYDGSKENTVECFGASREFLGMSPAGATPTSRTR